MVLYGVLIQDWQTNSKGGLRTLTWPWSVVEATDLAVRSMLSEPLPCLCSVDDSVWMGIGSSGRSMLKHCWPTRV